MIKAGEARLRQAGRAEWEQQKHNEKCQALDKKIAKDQARLWKACCRAAKRRWAEWARYPEGIKDVKRQYKYCLIELVEERPHLKRQHTRVEELPLHMWILSGRN